MPKLSLIVSPAEAAKLKRDAIAAGYRNVSEYIRATFALQPANLGGQRTGSGRPKKEAK